MYIWAAIRIALSGVIKVPYTIFFQNTNMYFKEFLPKNSEPMANDYTEEYFDVIVVPIHFL